MSRPKIKVRVGILCVEDDFISFELHERLAPNAPINVLKHARLPVGNGEFWFDEVDLNTLPKMILKTFQDYLPLDMLSISLFGGVDANTGSLGTVPRKDLPFKSMIDVPMIFRDIVKNDDPQSGSFRDRIIVNNDTVTMALGHAQANREFIAYVHLGRGVGCGVVHGLDALTSNGRHSEFGHLRARITASDKRALLNSEGIIPSNCDHHGGDHDDSENDKIPCLDGLLARSTLEKLPASIDKKDYLVTYASQLLAAIAITGIPDRIYVGGSSISRVNKPAEAVFEAIVAQFYKEISGFPTFPYKMFDPLKSYLQLSDIPSKENPKDFHTAAQKGAAILGWRKLDQLMKAQN